MVQKRHIQRDRYFREQAYTSENYVIPFLEDKFALKPGTEILEIGCGEGGNLKPFLDIGCRITGVDILEGKIKNAEKFFSDHPKKENLNLVAADIYSPPPGLDHQFDVILMRDVLEHIHDQERFMNYVKRFLKEDGIFFLGFPPWQNPFGGHQQMCYNRILNKLPWFHLLPGRLYPGLMKLAGEPASRIDDLLEIRDTRISIEGFERIVKREKYKNIKRVFWFINPNYKIKFGLKPRKMNNFIGGIPWLRNFFITTCYYILSKNKHDY